MVVRKREGKIELIHSAEEAEIRSLNRDQKGERMVRTRGLRETLHTSGRRLTRQRRLVLRVLEESREHLDAERLYDLATSLDPNISLATVYRTLAILKEMGLVEEHRLGEGHAHFEATRSTPHYHFTCTACGRVNEFDVPAARTRGKQFRSRSRSHNPKTGPRKGITWSHQFAVQDIGQ